MRIASFLPHTLQLLVFLPIECPLQLLVLLPDWVVLATQFSHRVIFVLFDIYILENISLLSFWKYR